MYPVFLSDVVLIISFINDIITLFLLYNYLIYSNLDRYQIYHITVIINDCNNKFMQ